MARNSTSPGPWTMWTLALLVLTTAGCAPQAADDARTSSAPVPPSHFYVDDGGQGGLPVVFVHSFAGSSEHWAAQLAHLRQTRRAIALDLRGHGKSLPPPSGSYAVDSLAGDIAAVVDGLGLDRFILVGHSMGGSAAIAYAGAHPEKAAGLVLVGTPGKTPPEQASQVMASLQSDYDKVMEGYWKKLSAGAQPAVEARISSEWNRISQPASLGIISALFAFDPLPALRNHTGPKLLIDTSHSESPGSLHELAPDIPRRVIEGTSHWPQLDKPEDFNRILDEFLAFAS